MHSLKINIHWIWIWLYTLAFSFLPGPLLFVDTQAATQTITAQSLDTIAGYSTMLTSSVTQSNQEVTFRVEKPDGGVINVFAETNPAGIAKTEFLGYHTKKSGTYKVFTFLSSESPSNNFSTFEVFPDTVSATQSSITSSSHSLEANNLSEGFISVRLRDKYNNPVAKHQINLISSRPEDKIEELNPITNENGEASFRVQSETAGISTYIASDINTNITLQDRVEIVYFNPTPYSDTGGNDELLLQLLSADSLSPDLTDLQTAGSTSSASTSTELFGTIDHFELIIPNQVMLNQEVNIEVLAKDVNTNTVKDYTGEISFAVESDPNSTLPADYQFIKTDQGEKKFSLGIKFSKTGRHLIEVFDKTNWEIKGEKEVDVVLSSPDSSNSTSVLQIKSPSDGLYTSQNIILISGIGNPNAELSLFINDNKIDNITVDGLGKFLYSAKNLTEGEHVIYVLENSSQSGEKSNSVTINIDLTPPSLSSFAITPEGPIATQSFYQVELTSEPNLEQAILVVNGKQEYLTESQFNPGTYEGTFTAPELAGNYPLQVIMSDAYQNKSNLDPHHVLQVMDEEEQKPPQVLNLQAEGQNQSVKLSWLAVTDHLLDIKEYNIYYGTEINNLSKAVKTGTPVTTFDVLNLENNQKYYFAMTAVDINGNESDLKSLIIEATPLKKEINLMAIPSDSQVTLSWDTFPNIEASKYKIYYGLKSKTYSQYLITPYSKTTYVVTNLVNNVPYYFIVAPIDALGQELKTYTAETSATPQSGSQQISNQITNSPNSVNSSDSGNNPNSSDANSNLGSNNYQPIVVRPSASPPQNITTHPPLQETGPETRIVILSSLLFVGLTFKIKKSLHTKY